MAPLITSSTSSHSTGPLRRATYVHVSDLTSAYNIDHAQLEREMARVNAKRKNLRCASVSDKNPVALEEVAGDLENTIEPTVPQKRLQPPRGGFNLCV